MNVVVYQTLDDRDNPDEIEEHGPYECRGGSSWLGNGYYFWDTHVQLGHKWGKTAYNGSYVVCEAVIDLNEFNCFDIHGNGEHMMEFQDTVEKINEIDDAQEVTVARVISFLKKMRTWSYSAIRVLGMNSFKRDLEERGLYWDEIKFSIGKKPFLDLYPPVQICVISKQNCNLRQWQIVYPNKYAEQYI